MRKISEYIGRFVGVVACFVLSALAWASPYRGTVTFGGLPLPGAIVTATQDSKTVSAVSDASGAIVFDDLADGKWIIEIQMQGFAPLHSEVTVAPNRPAASWELKLLPPEQIAALAQPAKPAIEPAPAPVATPQNQPAAQPPAQNKKQSKTQSNAGELPKAPEENEQGADGFLVQGSVNNAATSPYATSSAFGNTRAGSKALYTGGIVVNEENSALDARPYSLSGNAAAKPSYNDFTGVAALQGPIRIPHLLPRGPNFYISYQWTRNSSSVVNTGLVPTAGERSGIVPGFTNTITPTAQTKALLVWYPLPNLTNTSNTYNYQAPVLSSAHVDALQTRFDKSLGRKDQLTGGFAFQSTRSDAVNLFDFVDHTGTLGINGNIRWTHRLKPRLFLFSSYTFSRLRTEVTPNFANRINVSGSAGILGNDQDSADWGPPALSFSSGIAGLSDANSSFNRNRADSFSASVLHYHGKHNITAGFDFRKQSYNDKFQANPRGSFMFSSKSATGNGSDLADFLEGIPDTSSIAYGNANKYFREPVYDVYVNDDWRVLPVLTINAGMRWDYTAPISELFGNLVNLDVASGFTSVAAVEGSNPVGSITGEHYPKSLVRPDRRMIEPRIGITWRPIPASTVVIRAGYGIYPDTSVYQNIVLSMAQLAPLSTSLNAKNSTSCPLTLANGFTSCASSTRDTFGIDPNFRIGYAQTWQLSVQRDLPFALQASVTYSGTKGTHGPQEILPNSYALGESNPCTSCSSGFIYETSGGNSIRNAGQLQLRRRLRSGFSSTFTYTYAKSLDDDAYLGGQGHTSGSSTQSASLTTPSAAVAQNWRDPRAEHSLSSFDQRQLYSLQVQYTSGQGLGGGTLLGGWRGRALKEWTVLGNMSYGTGLPETPIYTATVPGTAFSNVLRPQLTGQPIYSPGSSRHLNVAAYAEPSGQWGNAGRNSIAGPGQFTFNSSLARTFRPSKKTYLDFAVTSNNTFNHTSFTGWNNYVTSTEFGLPSSAGAMRSLQTSFHLRFQ